MLKYALKRILQIIPTMLILSALVFYATRLLPGVPTADRVSFTGGNATHIEFIKYMSGVVRGDFGVSFRTGRPIINELVIRFPYTIMLAFGGIVIACLLGIILGIVAAVNHNNKLDNLIMVTSLVTTSMPLFFLAVMFMLFFCVHLGVLPSRGLDSWKGFILPIFTLGLPAVGFITRTTRSAMLDVLTHDYIRASKARGIPERVIVYAHAFRNTLIPIMTAVAVRFGELLAGTVLVENSFSIPGMGRLVLDAVIYGDYNVLVAGVISLALAFLIINLIIDLLYHVADPRLSYDKKTQ